MRRPPPGYGPGDRGHGTRGRRRERSSIAGGLVSTGAAAVELLNSRVRGAVTAGNQVGSLTCSGRGPALVDLGAPNAVRGATSGQCRIGSTPAA